MLNESVIHLGHLIARKFLPKDAFLDRYVPIIGILFQIIK